MRHLSETKSSTSTAEDGRSSFRPLEQVAPSTFSAVDYVGPFYIKEGRKELKRYGVLFTCMASRAIHLETASSLTTDSFLNAYRRFVCLRGPV